MAGWHCLSGYLYCKPTGAFSRLRSKKKQWYIFEESKHQLIYYRSEQEAKTSESLGAIDIEGASISLNLSENNEFIITSDGKEYLLQAENHESMMIWLLGLQAKRNALSTNGEYNDFFVPSDAVLNRRSPADEQRGSEPVIVDVPLSRKLSLHASSDFLATRQPLMTSSMIHLRGGGLAEGGLSTPRPLRLHQNRTHNHSGGNYPGDPGDTVIAEETDGDEDQTWRPPLLARSFSCNASDGLVQSSLMRIPRPPTQARINNFRLPLSQSFTTGVGVTAGPQHNDHSDSEEDVFNYDSLVEHGSAPAYNNRTPTRRSPIVSTNGNTARSPLTSTNGSTPRIETNTIASSNQSASLDSGIPKEEHSANESLSDDSMIEKETDFAAKVLELERELLCMKGELAQALNSEACLREIVEKREKTISDLDEKATRLEQIERVLSKKDKKSIDETTFKTSIQVERLQEQCRVLQNQNRFLNEEVKKLTQIRQKERDLFRKQTIKIKEYEMEMERWKRDYIFLLQSNITVPSGDVTEGFELNLYGGHRHKERLQEMLAEARLKNPGLPTFEKLTHSTHHVDSYGFKHTHDNDSLTVHYICRQLHDHFNQQLASYEQHQVKWKNFLRKNKVQQNSKELKFLCRAGIPTQYRCEVWRALVLERVKQFRSVKGQHYYNNISNLIQESEIAGNHRKQISLDLLRTLPTNVHFDHNDAPGIKKMQEVLQAFAIHNPEIGYCQGMNFITGMALLFLDKEDAFWCLCAVTEVYFPANYFNSNLIGAQTDQLVLKDLLADKLPRLYKHLLNLDIDIATITLNWFLAIFFDAVPFETLVRIWDCFLMEGPKVLFRFAVSILRIHEQVLLQQTDTISVWKHLKLAARLTYDVEGLIKVAFEDMKPFAKRRDISQKQSLHFNALREKEKNREQKRKAFQDTELKLQEIDNVSGNKELLECITCYQEGKLWLCHGEQNSARICSVNCVTNSVETLGCEFDSRILCICALTPDIVLLGSLAMNLYAFNPNTNTKLWQVQLHDTVMDLCVVQGEEMKQNKVFVALGDGTIAVLENVGDNEPMGNIFYIYIGYSPVTSVLLVNQELWCACGNIVQILHASTLDQKDRFRVSSNPFDHILTMRQGLQGVWIAVKGSSILELWDEENLICRLLFDVKENKYPRNKTEDDNIFNRNRITAVLPYNNTVWVGCGNGEVTVYEIWQRPGASPQHQPRFLLGSRTSHLNASLRSWTNSRLSTCPVAGDVGRRDEDEEDVTPKMSMTSSPRRRIEKVSRSSQTCKSMIHRKVLLNKEVGQDIKNKILELDLPDKTSDGLHLEIVIQVQDETNEPLPMTEDRGINTEPQDNTEYSLMEEALEGDGSQLDLSDDVTEDRKTPPQRSSPTCDVTEDNNSAHDVMEDVTSSNVQHPTSLVDCAVTSTPQGHISTSLGDLGSPLTPSTLDTPSRENVWIPGSANNGHTTELFASDEDTDVTQSPASRPHSPALADAPLSRFLEEDEEEEKDLYELELRMMAKNKIAESPIRCLQETFLNGEYLIISCASDLGEEEAVLKWKRQSTEEAIWTNEPIYKVIPQNSNLTSFMKHRMSITPRDKTTSD